jgi:hypothetical protein
MMEFVSLDHHPNSWGKLKIPWLQTTNQIRSSQNMGWFFPKYGKKMFQTTNGTGRSAPAASPPCPSSLRRETSPRDLVNKIPQDFLTI